MRLNRFLDKLNFLIERTNSNLLKGFSTDYFSLGVDDKLYFCSGYFNPPSPLIHAISSSDCLVELLSADREANGFNGAGFPKSGITPAYQLFADHMLSHIKDKQLNLQEWNREKERSN